MNKYTKNIKSGSRTSGRNSRKTDPWIFKLIMICTLMIGTIFAAFVLRLTLNSRTENLTRQAENIKYQIEEKEREIINLKNKREVLCSWDNIKKKIKEYNLALRPTEYHQIKYMKRYDLAYDNDVNENILAANNNSSRHTETAHYSPSAETRLASY